MSKSTKARSHGSYVRDIIIAHMISADLGGAREQAFGRNAPPTGTLFSDSYIYIIYVYIYIYIYTHGKRKIILGPAGRALCARSAGKNLVYMNISIRESHTYWLLLQV